MNRHVLIACPHLQRDLDRYLPLFAERGIEVESPRVDQQLTEDELIAIIDRFEGVIAGDDLFTARVLDRASRLRVISKWGVGLDGIDLEAARQRGVIVTNTPGQLAVEVAEVVVGYLVLLARGLHRIDAEVRQGHWAQPRGTTLAGKTIGIVGVGAAGRAVAIRATALGMKVLGSDPHVGDPEAISSMGISLVAMPHLLQASDFISLNCPLTPETYHLLGDREFQMMSTGIRLVNTSRGAVIDEAALVRALRDGTVAAAALDVFEREPLAKDNPLRGFENCIFGSHNSSNTIEAVERVNEVAVHNLLSVLDSAPR